MPNPKRFVYILKSLGEPHEYYVGLTTDPQTRLHQHNAGLSPHTTRHRPWRILVSIEFDEEEPAIRFERYLKTGSGRELSLGMIDAGYARTLRGARSEHSQERDRTGT